MITINFKEISSCCARIAAAEAISTQCNASRVHSRYVALVNPAAIQLDLIMTWDSDYLIKSQIACGLLESSTFFGVRYSDHLANPLIY